MGLLDNVDSQTESGKLAIDADSIVFFSAWEFDDAELSYVNFIERINNIKNACYSQTKELEDIKLCLTSKKHFRMDIYPEYKANRKTPTDEEKLLRAKVSALKKIIVSRLPKMILANNVAEADDTVVYLSRQGYIVSCIDGDVRSQSKTPVYDFKKCVWVHQGLPDDEIFMNTLIDSIAGKSKDNVKGVKGIGKVGAKKFVESVEKGEKSFTDWVELYPTPDEALLNFRLCSCNQYDGKEIVLYEMKDVVDMFTEHTTPPF